MCLYPKLITNPKYTSNKKNGGNIPPVKDVRTTLVPIGCGNCIECRKQKARGWQVRLLEDVKHNTNGKFITLTFSNKSIGEIIKKIEGLSGYELDNQIATYAVRHFLERWRKKYKKSLRHFLITEIGHNGTENIHLHGILWTNETFETITKIWNYGYVYPSEEKNRKQNYVNAKTVNYIIKYITKKDDKHKYFTSKILCSPGIGNQYTKQYNSKLNKFKGKDTDETYRTPSGHKIAIPIYWRNKIYTDEEREKLWLNRLDKQVMYVMGEKVDISKGYEEYDKLQKWYREHINKKLGYGDNNKNEERIQYERNRRYMKVKERLKKQWEDRSETPRRRGS